MKSVAISTSKKFRSEVEEFATYLEKNGIKVYMPDFEVWLGTNWEDTKEIVKRNAVLGLAWDHFIKIEKADVLFVYNKEGYVGNSVTMEIGYAAAFRKPIYALKQDGEYARDVLFEGYVNNAKELLDILRK